MKKRNLFRNPPHCGGVSRRRRRSVRPIRRMSALSRRAGKPRAGRRQPGCRSGTGGPRRDRAARRLLPLDRLRTRPARFPIGSPAGGMRPYRPAHPSARDELCAPVRPIRRRRRHRGPPPPAPGRHPADLLGGAARAASSSSLFGPPRNQQQPQQQIMPRGAADHHRGRSNQSLGGRRLVCVRTCDGFVLPTLNAPGGRQNADEMCQALCPGTETSPSPIPGSDNAMNRAVSLRESPTRPSPTPSVPEGLSTRPAPARRKTRAGPQSCGKAESMLDQKQGDILVTAQKSDELSRPKAAPAPVKAVRRKKPCRTRPTKGKRRRREQEAAVSRRGPTASQESSGIGPQSIETSKVVGPGEGAEEGSADRRRAEQPSG